MKKIKRKENRRLHPLMAYVLLILFIIILSGFLSIFDVQATYYKINNANFSFVPQSESINSMISSDGLKYIFANTVTNFASFTVLSNLIILLMGISILDKSGFLQTAITMTTKKLKKKTVTFLFVFICVCSSIIGDLSYLIFIPLGAFLFYYGKRNPAIGIISSFAALACGSSLSAILTSEGSSLLNYTTLAAQTVTKGYTMNIWSFLIIMIVSVILVSYIITIVTENIIVRKLPKYEFTESELEEDIVTNEEKRGMFLACTAALVYLLIFVYNIIPGLPLSGALLDNSQVNYIDKLFSINSFFNNGFIFIITILFIILGLFYGIGAKTIKNSKEFCDALGHSLDSVGNMLVLIFFASTFISIFKQTGMGNIVVASLSNFIGNSNFSGLPLVIVTFLIVALVNLLVPSSITKWTLMSATIVPALMKAGITPEFSQLIFRFGETSTMNITPLLAYFIVYLAFLEKYNQSENKIGFKESLKYQIPYTITISGILLGLIIIWYIIGMPIGINSYPTV